MSSPARAQGKNALQIPRRSMGIVCLGGKQGLVVMGPQSCVSAWKKSELPVGVGWAGGRGWGYRVRSLPAPLPSPDSPFPKNKRGGKKVETGETFKLPNFPLKGVIRIVNSPGSIHYPSAALSPTPSPQSPLPPPPPQPPSLSPPAPPSLYPRSPFPLRLQFPASAFNRRGSAPSLLGE